MTKEIDKITALKKAQFICARQEKCKSEIRLKLYEWKLDASLHDWVINSLIQEKFIDESRYTGFYVRDKFRLNMWGRIKIEYELKAKQIPQDLISSELNSIDEVQYYETCKKLLTQKLKSIKSPSSSEVKEKLIRYGYGRGFEPDLLFELAENLLREFKKHTE